MTNALGFTNAGAYDAISEVLALVDPGRLTRNTDPLANQTVYRYDAASRTTMRIDGRGLRTSYLYDADDRLIDLEYQDGTRATMTYDALGRRTVLSAGCPNPAGPPKKL